LETQLASFHDRFVTLETRIDGKWRPTVPLVQFFNSVEPVTDFFRDVVPELSIAGIQAEIVISRAEYRADRSSLGDVLAASKARIVRIAAGTGTPRGQLRKILVLMTYSIGALWRSWAGGRETLAFFLTQPPLFPLVGLALRKIRRQHYCCLVMDLYPQVLAADGALASDGAVYGLLARWMCAALSGADVVFVIGRCMRDRLIAEGVSSERIVVVHNWAHEGRIRPIERERNPLAQRFGIRSEFVVLYSGNMGLAHRFDTILAVAKRLRDRNDIQFVFLGEGIRRAEVTKEIDVNRLRNVRVAGLVPEADLAYSQSLGDVHFVCLRDEFVGLVVPSKTYSALAAGRAIIYEGASQGEIARMVRDERIGHVIDSGDVDSLEAAIVAMAGNRAATIAMGVRARELALGSYGRTAAVRRYVQVLSDLFRGRNGQVHGD
jgi:glycosyltransferase involved in cell wall biosynthesis